MMFSTEKCSGHSRSGSPDEAEIFAGGGEGLGKDGVASDEVASAVAAVSDDIGDILKDELGDADRADRIGAELADLSAELGILAGLDDGQPQADFPSLFEIAVSRWKSFIFLPKWLTIFHLFCTCISLHFDRFPRLSRRFSQQNTFYLFPLFTEPFTYDLECVSMTSHHYIAYFHLHNRHM